MCASCEEKDERIRQLETELYGRAWEPPCDFGLTPMQMRIVQAMVAAGDRVLSHPFLVEASRGATWCKIDYPDPKLITTVVFNIRQKLAPFGLVIETITGRGYRLTPASRNRLLHWTPAQERAA